MRVYFVTLLSLVSLAGSMQFAAADEKADALLKQVGAAYLKLQTFSADFTWMSSDGRKKTTGAGRIKLKKPNLAFIDLSKQSNETIVLDGQNVYRYSKSSNTYHKAPSRPIPGKELGMPDFTVFYSGNAADIGTRSLKPDRAARYAGVEVWKGRRFQVIEYLQLRPMYHKRRLFIGPNNLIERIVYADNWRAQPTWTDFQLTNVRADAPLADTVFTFTPPKGAKQISWPGKIWP